MIQIKDMDALQAWRQRRRGRWALVPTMGNLHAGHLSLLRRAREEADAVAVSIFVNPTQFAAGEDFGSYPRTPEADAALLAEAGADVLFMPDEALLYPFGTAGALSFDVALPQNRMLCALQRPQHFQGVLNVVARLLHLIRPEVALFGEKDFQQLWFIRRWAAEFYEPVRIVGAPTVRAADGLALSSRNAYLSAAERSLATALHRQLQSQREALRRGEFQLQAGKEALEAQGFEVDYWELRRSSDLSEIQAEALPAALASGDGRLFVAARLGRTRLIDNLAL